MSDHSFIYGFHTVLSRIKQAPETIRCIYLARQDLRAQEMLNFTQSLKVIHTSTEQLDKMVPHIRHQGIIASINPLPKQQNIFELLDDLQNKQETPLLLILDGIQDPHNLGACLRVADAAGVHAVLAPKDRSVGLTAAAMKVACGAADNIPYFSVTNLARELRTLKEYGIWIIGADGRTSSNAHSLYETRLTGPLAWVLGAEGEGLRRLTRENCDQLIHIPMLGTVESLNISVATGICLFETRRQQTFLT